MAAQNWAMRAGQKYASFGSSRLLWACGNDQTETQSQDRTPSQMLAVISQVPDNPVWREIPMGAL